MTTVNNGSLKYGAATKDVESKLQFKLLHEGQRI